MIKTRIHITRFVFVLLVFLISERGFSQQRQDTTAVSRDTTHRASDTTKRMMPADSLTKVAAPISHANRIDSIMKNHSPKKAAFRSAVLPGWGQVYNRKYWKLPIIYGALGVSAAVFAYNLNTYRDLRFAYTARYDAQPKYDPATGTTIPGDSTNYWQIRPDLVDLDMNALRSYRDEYRRNIDYSVLVFMLLWGLNVVDATVDAHLKAFDVSDELSLRFKIGPSEMARTNGLSLILAFNGKQQARNNNPHIF